LLPSWQITVVPELGGTTTVVDFAGGGLLLLMQADSRGTTHKAASSAFMDGSSCSLNGEAIFTERRPSLCSRSSSFSSSTNELVVGTVLQAL
jgi:hypothetical protein